jgi:hypothetical protein
MAVRDHFLACLVIFLYIEYYGYCEPHAGFASYQWTSPSRNAATPAGEFGITSTIGRDQGDLRDHREPSYLPL